MKRALLKNKATLISSDIMIAKIVFTRQGKYIMRSNEQSPSKSIMILD